MKLILQIALGVFIGTLASQFIIDSWQTHQENRAKFEMEKLQAEQKKIRTAQGERIRKLLLQNRQDTMPMNKKPPADFIPDDAKEP